MSLRDPDRFGVIFDRYFTEIHGYVARRLGDEAADDIAAETFLTAFGKRERFDASRGIVRGWLYGIATNHMSRYRRCHPASTGRPPAGCSPSSSSGTITGPTPAHRTRPADPRPVPGGRKPVSPAPAVKETNRFQQLWAATVTP
jgi:DNA-directed RNA polymerase specialized sigma24 family protein